MAPIRALRYGCNSILTSPRDASSILLYHNTSITMAPPTTTVFVGNISYEATDKDLNSVFGALEDVRSIRIATDRNTGWPIGYAHADFHSVEAATKAIDVLKAQKIGGRSLRVSFASQTQDAVNRRRAREGGDRGQRRSREPREPREPRE
ncbi:uncharacterized protein VDAG_03291 [Verticillium dahliae VdLs.17]|uniref:RRM domain-containing protein n=1 Tax=Verticillium dahliae (strain VdLs.17 / ATCC MYA-4575 / FGSC 10137) TaxID=498257 RepID=G2WZ49_VERDV|nr:uncharacterized protein VDAG_03291 [Verticillium dahliae VdLs.17]EGY21851.1 hypothetical protein VDAG_03291 [Verticillium dahliae VdLs.17]